MIDALADWVKAYALPGSPWLLLGGATLAAALVSSSKYRRWGQRLLIALVAAYWLLASPWFSGLLHAGLDSGYRPLEADPGGMDAIVILGGGAANYRMSSDQLQVLSDASAERALEGARLYDLLGPAVVVVSGGPADPGEPPESRALRDALVDLGVPEAVILEEHLSRDTFEQARQLGPLVQGMGIGRFVLVTSEFHMRRSLAVFRAAGWDPIASPSAAGDPDTDKDIFAAFLPDNDALKRSELASREYLALVYYWVRGRIDRPWGTARGID